MIYGLVMGSSFMWWFWLVVVVFCILSLPGLWQMLIESIKEYERNKDE